jgi:hypothetical protein
MAQVAVNELVVDLGDDSEAGTPQALLAQALGDQSLAIGYWLPKRTGISTSGAYPSRSPKQGRARRHRGRA